MLPFALLALAHAAAPATAQTAGSIVQAGDTLVSAMMMFLGNDQKVYIMDKVEGNKHQINGHSAYAAVWDIATKTATAMDFSSNAFCSSGMHLPNGSFATFGGNGAMGPSGNGSDASVYGDTDGGKSIRILNPCIGDASSFSAQCQWFDNATQLSMVKRRWYSTAEPLGDGTVALIGGFSFGGYINRNWPNVDPDEGDVTTNANGAQNTYEFYPTPDNQAPKMPFMRNTSGLNAYPHAFLMPSGKMYLQANYSTILWDPKSGDETYLPDTPGQVMRVYPASGAVAMLPMTPKNNWNPTIILCGGQSSAAMPDYSWGNYSWPFVDTWNVPATKDCQRITPEPTDGTSPQYVQDDDMIQGRTMGQFIILPNGKLLVVNGGANGTAGYSTQTLTTLSFADMPFGMSLASGPVGTPAIYDPNAPVGSRWSNTGLSSSSIARLYHSSAILLPDASVLIAGSNPNVDVNTSTIFPTQYTAEIFYPPYFAASTRPTPSGMPKTISYGGPSFDLTIPASSYAGSANDAADNSTVVLMRPGWTTHAMNMGQRMLQLNNTYTVNSDGSFVLHTAQHPPNPNLLTPGPALLFVVVNGIPSNGTMVTVGSGTVGVQPTQAAAVLPQNVRLDSASGSAPGNSVASSGGNGNGKPTTTTKLSTGAVIGGIVAAVALIAIIGAIVGVCLSRRRRSRAAAASTTAPGGYSGGAGYAMEPPKAGAFMRSSDGSAFAPLQDNASAASLHPASPGPYQGNFHDDPYGASRGSFALPPMQEPGHGPIGYDGQYHNPADYGRHTPQPSYDQYYDDSHTR